MTTQGHAATVREAILRTRGRLDKRLWPPTEYQLEQVAADLDEIERSVVSLAERADEVEAQLAEIAVAPDEWRDEDGKLRGYEQGDDPRDALDRLGFIYGSLEGEKKPPARSVALEALRLADSQIQRADELESERDKSIEGRDIDRRILQGFVDEARGEADQLRAEVREAEKDAVLLSGMLQEASPQGKTARALLARLRAALAGSPPSPSEVEQLRAYLLKIKADLASLHPSLSYIGWIVDVALADVKGERTEGGTGGKS
jgi:hypothetical protein